MSPNPGELKAALRRQLRERARQFSAAEREVASLQICQRLREQRVWRQAGAVLFYHPMQDEPAITPLIAEGLATGKAALLPRYFAETGQYQACGVQDLERDLQPGAFGIREPAAVCSVFDLKKLDLLLVPGIGFTLDGFRLGRGKGYYDRLLAETPGFKCGVAFDWQVIVEIPAEPHDICLDCILTPGRWQEVTGRRGFDK